MSPTVPWSRRPYDERAAAAANPASTRDTLRTLASDEKVSVRGAVASNPSAPARTLVWLGQSQAMCGYLARNPATFDITVRRSERRKFRWLTEDPWGLKEEVSLFAVISASPDVFVRLGQAGNPRCPDVILAELLLCSEFEGGVARRAARTLGSDGLRRLARSKNAEIRIAAANSPKTPSETLVTLEGDSDPRVRSAATATIVARLAGGGAAAHRLAQLRIIDTTRRSGKPRQREPVDPLLGYFDGEPSDADLRRIDQELREEF